MDGTLPACHLLQTKIHLQSNKITKEKETQRTNEPNFSVDFPFFEPNVTPNVTLGICLPNVTSQEAAQPIADVVAHYGGDGYCTFGFAGYWASGCAITRREQSALYYATQFNAYYTAVLTPTWATPFTLQLFDGRTVAIRNRNYPLDDLYCYVNGWYSFKNRAQVVNNFTYLEEISDTWCTHLANIVPGFSSISLKDFAKESNGDEEFLENLMKHGASSGHVPKSVVDGMYLHAAVKCLLRGPKGGAVCDIADCAAQGCFAESSNELLYTVRGECESVTVK